MREPSPLRAAVRLLMRSVRAGAPSPSAAAPRRRAAAERRGIEIDPRRVRAFRRVTGGEDGAEGASPLPPTYPALWETALALELLTAADLPLPTRGVIHLESERVSLRPLYPDDRPRCRVELDRAERHPLGLRLALACRSWNGAGQLCSEATLTLLARLPDAEGRRVRKREERFADGEGGEWREVESWRLRANHGRRFARVSGDFNPIHLWSWSSRPFGFQRPILHGVCLESMVAHALVRRWLGGDPAALRRLRIAFRAPLLLPARVRLEVAPRASGGGTFRVLREGSGRPVAEGEFVGER